MVKLKNYPNGKEMKHINNKNYPHITTEDSKTRKSIKVHRCAYVFKDPLTDIEIAMIEKDEDLILKKVERGYFISHHLNDANWARRYNITISRIYPPREDEYPTSLLQEVIALH